MMSPGSGMYPVILDQVWAVEKRLGYDAIKIHPE
jgi:hypothetical protein